MCGVWLTQMHKTSDRFYAVHHTGHSFKLVQCPCVCVTVVTHERGPQTELKEKPDKLQEFAYTTWSGVSNVIGNLTAGSCPEIRRVNTRRPVTSWPIRDLWSDAGDTGDRSLQRLSLWHDKLESILNLILSVHSAWTWWWLPIFHAVRKIHTSFDYVD